MFIHAWGRGGSRIFQRRGGNSNAWPLRHDEGRVQEGDVPTPVLCAEIFAEGCLRELIDLVCSQSLMNVLVHHFHDTMNIINLEGGGGGGSSPLSPPPPPPPPPCIRPCGE